MNDGFTDLTRHILDKEKIIKELQEKVSELPTKWFKKGQESIKRKNMNLKRKIKTFQSALIKAIRWLVKLPRSHGSALQKMTK